MANAPTVLVILDGWGYREETADNAVAQAETPNFDRIWASCPHALLRTDGPHVGLPEGQFGNSEVGHMNLGAGRVVLQDLPRVDAGLADGKIRRNEQFQAFVARLQETGGRCHLMGLVSPGGVHAHQDQIAALARALAAEAIEVVIHVFTDGRDTAPKGGAKFVKAFLDDLEEVPDVSVGTVIGRYYAMDRDKRWERVQRAFAAMVDAKGEAASGAVEAIEAAYDRGEGDEFIQPTVVEGYAGLAAGDGILAANFRADRIREILLALLDPNFDGFDRGGYDVERPALALVEYGGGLERFMQPLFAPEDLVDLLGDVLAAHGKRQLRLAETEKYPHVTFFFNGGDEVPRAGEDRVLVPSPKVPTYDLQPEMSAPEVGRHLAEAIRGGEYDFILCNFANPDMVGHTGSLSAAIQAVETVDAELGHALAAAAEVGATLLVTADHGNCDVMKDPETGEPHTAHTLNPVPCVLVGGPRGGELRTGRLADVAPTLLALMQIEQPAAMTGRSLLVEHRDA
ncbi:MAG: 2,3-bisphosphoglycerate-independent phosphoglycerate mutase [Geminicoccaceae bacterium]|nr:MAG: 2,3-bisphosphoglycerate-independent phosphoglycerate mutase [Geminicoccaceae bacterium]